MAGWVGVALQVAQALGVVLTELGKLRDQMPRQEAATRGGPDPVEAQRQKMAALVAELEKEGGG